MAVPAERGQVLTAGGIAALWHVRLHVPRQDRRGQVQVGDFVEAGAKRLVGRTGRLGL